MTNRRSPYRFRYQIGERTLFSVDRQLDVRALSLVERLSGAPVAPPSAGGTLYRGVPVNKLPEISAEADDMIFYVRERFPNHYADLSGTFDAYLAGMSSNARSGLKRKSRKFAKFCGGELDIREYRQPDEMAEFYQLARQISAHTYQEKLLDAGLPEGAAFRTNMVELAAENRVRAWILFHDSQPVSYLYCPVDQRAVIYAYLGYLPDYARHSVGSVLQLHAMESLYADGSYDIFDFTSGDGQHKRQFATGKVDCADVIVLPKGTGNQLLVGTHRGFGNLIDGAADLADRMGLKARLKRLLRRA